MNGVLVAVSIILILAKFTHSDLSACTTLLAYLFFGEENRLCEPLREPEFAE